MRILSVSALIVLYASIASAVPVLWPASEGGNDHHYELIENVTWREAFDLSGSMWYLGCQGHLVTIGNTAEDDWLKATFPPWEYFFIGLYQTAGSPEPDGGWTWVTGEPATYLNWQGEEPNNGRQGEDFGAINPPTYGPGGWIDIWDYFTSAAIIEYDTEGVIGRESTTFGHIKRLFGGSVREF